LPAQEEHHIVQSVVGAAVEILQVLDIRLTGLEGIEVETGPVAAVVAKGIQFAEGFGIVVGTLAVLEAAAPSSCCTFGEKAEARIVDQKGMGGWREV
jgi:hypothetical protein